MSTENLTPEELAAQQLEAEKTAKAEAEAKEKEEKDKHEKLKSLSEEEKLKEILDLRSEAKQRRLKEKELSDRLAEFEKKQADEIEKDNLIHIIGTGGHSNLIVEEALWRAGGLAPINAMLDCGTNLMMGAKRSNIVERTPGYGIRVLDMYGCKEGELILICKSFTVGK